MEVRQPHCFVSIAGCFRTPRTVCSLGSLRRPLGILRHTSIKCESSYFNRTNSCRALPLPCPTSYPLPYLTSYPSYPSYPSCPSYPSYPFLISYPSSCLCDWCRVRAMQPFISAASELCNHLLVPLRAMQPFIGAPPSYVNIHQLSKAVDN